MTKIKGDSKKELKRYTLCEYGGEQVRYFHSYKDFQDLILLINDINKKGKSPFFYGNISCEKKYDVYEVKFHVYNRLTPKMTISELDALTSNKTEEELINKFSDFIKTRKPYIPDINIMYFEEKNSNDKDEQTLIRRIKYIPVLYSRDKRFLDRNYIQSCIKVAAREHDINFFKKMANEFCFHHVIVEYIEKLRYYIDLCKRGENMYSSLSSTAIELYEALIRERKSDKRVCMDEKGEPLISRRRLRDFGFFVRDYLVPTNRINIPTRYNNEPTEKQLEELNKKEEKKLERKVPQAEQLKLF